MLKLMKAVSVENSDMTKNKIYLVEDEIVVDGVELEGFVKLVATGQIVVEERLDVLDLVANPRNPVVALSSTENLTAGKMYNVDTTWESSQQTYVVITNDIGKKDYFNINRFKSLVPAPAVPATPAVPTSQFGFVKCVDNHKFSTTGNKKVKRLTEGTVYELVKPANTSTDFYFIKNDVGNVEDFKKSRFVVVTPVVTTVTWRTM